MLPRITAEELARSANFAHDVVDAKEDRALTEFLLGVTDEVEQEPVPPGTSPLSATQPAGLGRVRSSYSIIRGCRG